MQVAINGNENSNVPIRMFWCVFKKKMVAEGGDVYSGDESDAWN